MVYLAVLLAPFAITLDFLLQRDRIARELCVQRAVPEGERTCHGQCCLKKQLLTEETTPTSPSTPPVLPQKIHPELLALAVKPVNDVHVGTLAWAFITPRPLAADRDPAEPVPWS